MGRAHVTRACAQTAQCNLRGWSCVELRRAVLQSTYVVACKAVAAATGGPLGVLSRQLQLLEA